MIAHTGTLQRFTGIETPNSTLTRFVRPITNPQSEWLQSSSESELDIDEEQFLLNADDMAAEVSDSYNSDSDSNGFAIQDEYIDDDEELNPDLYDPVPNNSDIDNNSNISYTESELDPDNYFLDPEGLNLPNPTAQASDSDLEHYLVGPDGIYLDNQGFSDNDSASVSDLDPESPSGPVDPG